MKRLLKIMGKAFLGMMVLLFSAMLICVWFAKANSKQYGNNEKVLKSNKVNAKKALVVYQPSRSKLTDGIAESIAKAINEEGYEVTINYPGKHMTTDVSQYSIVVLGSPVYVGQTSSTLSDYMKSIKCSPDQKIMLFVTGAQLNNGELDKMEKQLGGGKVAEKAGFKNGTKDVSKAYEEGKRIVGE